MGPSRKPSQCDNQWSLCQLLATQTKMEVILWPSSFRRCPLAWAGSLASYSSLEHPLHTPPVDSCMSLNRYPLLTPLKHLNHFDPVYWIRHRPKETGRHLSSARWGGGRMDSTRGQMSEVTRGGGGCIPACRRLTLRVQPNPLQLCSEAIL